MACRCSQAREHAGVIVGAGGEGLAGVDGAGSSVMNRAPRKPVQLFGATIGERATRAEAANCVIAYLNMSAWPAASAFIASEVRETEAAFIFNPMVSKESEATCETL